MTHLHFQDAADAAMGHQLALMRICDELAETAGLLEGMRKPVRVLQIATHRLAPTVGPVWTVELLAELEQLNRRIAAALAGTSAASTSAWQALQHGECLLREQKAVEAALRDVQRKQ